jgi:hypothetical protein
MSTQIARNFSVVALAALLALAGARTRAACPGEWVFAPGQALPGVHGSVYATAVYDDGSGPALYVGGEFDIAGDILVANIAKWDGTRWSALGSGVAGTVSALSVYNGELIAGGQFTAAGGVSAACIARWNGTSWAPLDAGLAGSSAAVSALAVYDGALIAGGTFASAGGTSANNIARWDGTSWDELASGMDASVGALAVWNDQLVAGGAFHTAGGLPAERVALWDGVSWSALGSGTPGNVYALAAWGPDLVAGGRSFQPFILRWDGAAWGPLGEGLAGVGGYVNSLTSYDGWLIAGGKFDHSGATELSGIAGWDGQSWQPVAEPWAVSQVSALDVYDDELIVAGASEIGAGLVRWNGERWDCVGGAGQIWGGPIYAFGEYEGDLVTGGRLTLGGSLSVSIARFDGTRWQALGVGLTGETEDYVYALVAYQGDLIAAGTFRWADDVEVNYVARWDGSDWHPMGDGFDSYVNALAVYQGELIAGGWFNNSGLAETPHLARWTGVDWEPLGGGTDGEVHVLYVWDDALIVGGRFSSAGGVSASCIARWDGITYQPLSSGMDFRVLALAEYQNQLVAGGSFHRAGGVLANGIARWDGGAWHAMGTGPVMELAPYHGELWGYTAVAAARDTVYYQLTRWNGQDWVLQHGVLDGTVAALAVWDKTLVVGGSFLTVSGRVAPVWLRWTCPYDHGDLNCDTEIDVFDIDPFVLALTDPAAYQAQYEGCDRTLADINNDGSVNTFDIDPFVLLLTRGGD